MHAADPLLRDPGHFRVEAGGVDELGLEHVAEVAGAVVEVPDGFVEDTDRLGAAIQPEQRAAELEADPRAPDRILDLLQRLGEVACACDDVDAAFRQSQL